MEQPKIQFKSFVGELKAWDDNELVIEHFISTESQDSGGDIMLAAGMKIRGRPVVLFQHGMDQKYGNEPIAKVLDIKVGEFKGKKGLIAKTKYYDGRHLTPPDSTGQRLYEKAKDGTMPNWSIGFNSLHETPTKGGRIVDDWELHEYSQVAVGMNAEACTLSTSAPELKFMIVQDYPEGFADMKSFLDGTIEVQYVPGQEMVCAGGLCKMEGEKPYPNEHACRLADPSGFSKMRRQNGARDHDGKKYDVIYGQKKGSDKWAEQAYRYPKDVWSADAAAAHCKSHDGSFEAAKALTEASMPAYKRAHKAIHTFHKEMIGDLKEHAAKPNLMEEGTEKCAKAAIDDFAENAEHHVEKYVKAVRDMGKDDEFDDEPKKVCPECGKDPCECEDGDTGENEETKGYRKCSNALHGVTKAMIEGIREHKGKKEAVPSEVAARLLKAHSEAALPHAKAFIKEWHDKINAASAAPEKKPQPSVPAEDEKPKKVFRLKPPAAAPAAKFRMPRQSPPVVTEQLVRTLISEATSGMSQTIRAEIRKAAGRVTP